VFGRGAWGWLLASLSNPNVAFVLLLFGVYGLFVEFASPGLVAPGVLGALALLAAFYALQLMPVNYVGLGLMLPGIAFMVAEVFLPSFGALGIGGMVAFAVGSVILLDSDVPGYELAWPVVASIAASSVIFFVILSVMVLRERRRPAQGRS
jgi:membrane-bound serine protease (ClpP class)